MTPPTRYRMLSTFVSYCWLKQLKKIQPPNFRCLVGVGVHAPTIVFDNFTPLSEWKVG